MSKRKTQAQGIYITREDQRASRVSAVYDPEVFEASLKAMVKDGQESADDTIDRIRASLAAFLQPFLGGPIEQEEAMQLLQSGQEVRPIDLGDGVQTYLLSDATEAARDAIDGLHEVQTIAHQLSRDGGIGVAMFLKSALRLGQLCERLQVRPFEKMVGMGVTASRKGKLGAEKKHSENRKLWAKYQTLVEEKMAYGHSYTEATEAVAVESGVSGRTVWNHTTNPDTA